MLYIKAIHIHICHTYTYIYIYINFYPIQLQCNFHNWNMAYIGDLKWHI